MKVFELAKELRITNNELMVILSQNDINVKSINSTLTKQNIECINVYIKTSLNSKGPKIVEEKESRTVELKEKDLTVSKLAKILELGLSEIMLALLNKGLLLNLNSEIDLHCATEIAKTFIQD